MNYQDELRVESQGTPEDSGKSSGEENQIPKSLVDRAKELNDTHKMISKSTDGKTLKSAQAKIRPMIRAIQERIEQIKVEGRQTDDVSTQKVLYSEYEELEPQLKRLETKDTGIDKALTELTDKQKEFFGLTENSSKEDEA